MSFAASLTAVLLCSVGSNPAVDACSIFVLNGEKGPIVGRNDDILVDGPVPGILIVNPRGAEKAAFPVDPRRGDEFIWTSRYGSVTFSYLGRNFPDGGMNEAGLVIEEASLNGSQKPVIEQSHLLFQPQWIQYQLDRHSTVDEVVSSLDSFTPVIGAWHYVVADAKGEVAIIEFIDGETVIHRSSEIDPVVLTNRSYGSCRDTLKGFDGFGGDAPIPGALTADAGASMSRYEGLGGSDPIPEGVTSEVRFARAAAMLMRFEKARDSGEIDLAFNVLESMSFGVGTKRSIVHDVPNRSIRFRTDSCRRVRSIELGELDFSAGRPYLYVDLNRELTGNLRADLEPWSPDRDLPMIEVLLMEVVHNPDSERFTVADSTSGVVASDETLVEFYRRLHAWFASLNEPGVQDPPG